MGGRASVAVRCRIVVATTAPPAMNIATLPITPGTSSYERSAMCCPSSMSTHPASRAARVVNHFAAGATSTTATFPALTEREREVLALIAAGKGNATIAHELMISLKTVRNHVSNIFTKLQVSDRSSAIVKARRAGMSDDRPS